MMTLGEKRNKISKTKKSESKLEQDPEFEDKMDSERKVEKREAPEGQEGQER